MNAHTRMIATLTLFLTGVAAHATAICTGCEYRDGSAGTYAGAYDGTTFDVGTFQNTQVGGGTTFADFWVFDVDTASVASISADFTLLAGLGDFTGTLFRDDGSVCGAANGAACTSVATGAVIGTAAAVTSRWELFQFLTPGRYVLRIDGVPNPFNRGAYTGQLSFLAVSLREAGSLSLMLLGLPLMLVPGAVRRFRRVR